MFALHSRLLPNGFSWQLSQQSGLHWARRERAAAPKQCLQISSVPPHQLSCLRQDSRAALRAVGTAMGFPTAKLSQRTQAFPKLPSTDCVCCWCLIPGRRLGNDFGRLSAARWPWLLPLPCGEEQNQNLTQEGEENLSRLPCMGRMPAGTASSSANNMLEGPAWVEILGKEAKMYGCMKGETNGSSAFARCGWLGDILCTQRGWFTLLTNSSALNCSEKSKHAE